MKKTITTLSIILLLSVTVKGQCGFVFPSDTTVCFGENTSFYMTGAQNYTWSVSGSFSFNNFSRPDTSRFVVAFNWKSSMTVSAELNGCKETKIITVSLIQGCFTGIQSYLLDTSIAPIYFDITGRPTKKIYNQVLIEQRGNHRRKVIFQE